MYYIKDPWTNSYSFKVIEDFYILLKGQAKRQLVAQLID